MGHHKVGASCAGQRCRCGAEATHKMGEEVLDDDPLPIRHNLTAYVCCTHFHEAFGPAAVPCGKPHAIEWDREEFGDTDHEDEHTLYLECGSACFEYDTQEGNFDFQVELRKRGLGAPVSVEKATELAERITRLLNEAMEG